MSQVSAKYMNIVEWCQHFHNGELLPEIEMLAQRNQCVMDIPWTECNDGTTHLYSMETVLPTVELTALGQGTTESKSQSAQEREHCTMLSGFSTVPEQTSLVGGQQGAMRAKEDRKFAEAMRQAFARHFLYGNRGSNVLEPWGFITRMNTLTGVKAANVISCAEGSPVANAQCSALLLNYGPGGVYGIFPKGTTAGYQRMDRGVQVKTLSNGKQLTVLQTEHCWHFGFVVENWANGVVRLCNIGTAAAQGLSGNLAATSTVNVLHKMVDAQMRLRTPMKPVWYVNDVVHAYLMRVGMEKSSSVVKVQEAVTQFGNFQELTIYDVPVRRIDQMLRTEAVVT